MKLFFVMGLICLMGNLINAQTLEVHYDVKSPRQLPLGDGKIREIILEYDGIIYNSGDSTISFLKPKYLLDYPSGNISVEISDNNSTGMSLDMDTMQRINLFYENITKYWSYNTSTKQYFTVNSKQWAMPWKLLPETKEINGFLCKHAVVYNSGDTNNILYDIWYYPEVKFGYGLLGLKEAPGLVVECNFAILKMSYTLKYFKKDEPINRAIFWPKEFDKVTFEDYTTPKKVSEKDKKKQAINSQQ
jgi:GLPGLI family protein